MGDFEEKDNPWKTLGSRLVYDTAWFGVREDRVIRPDGAPGTYSVIDARRWALGIVPLWQDQTVTLVGQYRYPIGEYSWEIPEGGGDLRLEPLVGAKQELLEETGIEAGLWHYLGRCHTSNSFVNEVAHIYLATDLTQGEPRPGGDEKLRTRRLPLPEVIQMAQDGRITDSISVVGIFRVARYLRLI